MFNEPSEILRFRSITEWIGPEDIRDNSNVIIETSALNEITQTLQEAVNNTPVEVFGFLLGSQTTELSGKTSTRITGLYMVPEKYHSKQEGELGTVSTGIAGTAWSDGLLTNMNTVVRELKEDDSNAGIVGTIHTHQGLRSNWLTPKWDESMFKLMETRAKNSDWIGTPVDMVHLVYDQGTQSSVSVERERLTIWSRNGVANPERHNGGRPTEYGNYKMHVGFKLKHSVQKDDNATAFARRLNVATNPLPPSKKISIKM